jgi:hypothetical protein
VQYVGDRYDVLGLDSTKGRTSNLGAKTRWPWASQREAAEESMSSSRGGGGSYDSDNLSLFVNDLSDICKELVGSSEEHTSFAVVILFDEEIGVFSILECIMRICDKSVAKAREDCLKFVEAFVKQIGGGALPHAAFLKVSE